MGARASRNLSAQMRASHATNQGFIHGQAMVTSEPPSGPLSVQAAHLLTTIQDMMTPLEALESTLPIKTLTPARGPQPDGLTATLAACHTELEVLRGMIEGVAARIGHL